MAAAEVQIAGNDRGMMRRSQCTVRNGKSLKISGVRFNRYDLSVKYTIHRNA